MPEFRIEVIEEKEASGDDDSDEGLSEEELLVAQCIERLVDHFRQSIHREQLLPESTPILIKRCIHKDDFIIRNPVTRYLYEELTGNMQSIELITILWIAKYTEKIRPMLFDEEQYIEAEGITPLIEYSLVLSKLILTTRETMGSLVGIHSTDYEEILEDAMLTWSRDLTYCTRTYHRHEKKSLPLQHYTDHIIPSFMLMIRDVSSRWRPSETVLRRCAISLAAFSPPSPLSFESVNPEMKERILHASNYLRLQPNEEKIDFVLHGFSFDEVQPLNASWSSQDLQDFRVEVLRAVFSLHESDPQLSDAEFPQIAPDASLFWAKAVRSHFFGRDMNDASEMIVVKQRLYLGKMMEFKEKKGDDIKPYLQIPSRIYVAIRFLQKLTQISKTVLDEVLPICFELLDSQREEYRPIGAASMHHLLQLSRSSGNKDIWLDHSHNILEILEHSVKTSRIGVVLATAGIAQYALFEILPKNQFQKRRRRATQNWLDILSKNVSFWKPPLVCGLLCGGVLPSLYGHTFQENADIMELGRVGLEALLPLLDVSRSGSLFIEIRICALIAISNLLIGAHPVMRYHGGKLMGCLIACTSHARERFHDTIRDENYHLYQTEHCLSLHVSCMAVVVGDEAATEVLSKLEEQASTYRPIIQEVIQDIRQGVQHLPKIRDFPTSH